MFLENKIKSQQSALQYLLGFVIISLFYFLGQIPLGVALVFKTFGSDSPIPTTEEAMMKVFSPNVTLFLLLMIFVFTMIGIIIVVKYLHKLKMIDIITTRTTVDWSRILFSFFFWAILSGLMTLAAVYAMPEHYELNFKWGPFLILVLISFTLLPIQTSAEEFIFRGYLMQGLGILAMNRWFPLVVTSLLFGLMHIMNPEVEKMGYIIMIYYIGTGFFLGIITLMDEGMELALGFHAANNIITALLVTADWSALKTESVFKDISTPSVGLEVLTPVLVIFPIVLFVFSRKYQWTDWKEKLTGKIYLQTTQPMQNLKEHE
jgi:membrane protease YdiL (CAAX protease family)